jgi:hypothetical protein
MIFAHMDDCVKSNVANVDVIFAQHCEKLRFCQDFFQSLVMKT